MNAFQDNLIDYVLSGHAIISINTYEKDRATDQIKIAAKNINKQVYVWSIATGWQGVTDDESTTPELAIQKLVNLDEDSICILKDFGTYLNHNTYNTFDVVIAWLEEIKQIVCNARQTIVFLGPDFEVPNILKHDITQMDFNLPDEQDILNQINFVCEGVVKEDGSKFEPDKKRLAEVINACKGMTQQETIDRVALSLRKCKDLNEQAVRTILHEKAGVIRSSGLLNYIEPPAGGLSIVGGYDALKEHIKLDKPCFSDEAQDFGIEFPKGVILAGLPGTGKTLLSMAIASEFNLPLVSLDVGNLMGSLVGESESNMREVIKIIESVSPLVLQIDEVEKSFGGNGDLDGGSSKRVFGAFLKWLNDRNSPVYTVATANNVLALPIEFSRAGRFDAIFGLDLPNLEERKAIFAIHIAKRNRKPSDFCLYDFAKAACGFVGSDIEQAVKLALKMAFVDNRQLSHTIIIDAIESIIPLSKTEPQRIKEIQKWCAMHSKPANSPKETLQTQINHRKIEIN